MLTPNSCKIGCLKCCVHFFHLQAKKFDGNRREDAPNVDNRGGQCNIITLKEESGVVCLHSELNKPCSNAAQMRAFELDAYRR